MGSAVGPARLCNRVGVGEFGAAFVNGLKSAAKAILLYAN
jgi:hypothetical protein